MFRPDLAGSIGEPPGRVDQNGPEAAEPAEVGDVLLPMVGGHDAPAYQVAAPAAFFKIEPVPLTILEGRWP